MVNENSAHQIATQFKTREIIFSHGSSVGEWMYLTVCPPCGPSHDSSVGEWMYLTVCSLLDPGSIPDHGGAFQGIFRWLITCAALYTVEGVSKSVVAPPNYTSYCILSCTYLCRRERAQRNRRILLCSWRQKSFWWKNSRRRQHHVGFSSHK